MIMGCLLAEIAKLCNFRVAIMPSLIRGPVAAWLITSKWITIFHLFNSFCSSASGKTRTMTVALSARTGPLSRRAGAGLEWARTWDFLCRPNHRWPRVAINRTRAGPIFHPGNPHRRGKFAIINLLLIFNSSIIFNLQHGGIRHLASQ